MAASDSSEGLPEELFVAREALDNGCNVSFPYGGKAKYDLLIERGGEILKIQVKTAITCRGDGYRQMIRNLEDYTGSEVDFFAGVVDLDEAEADSDVELCMDGSRHVFYKEFDRDDGKTARVNYKHPEEFENEYHLQEAKLANDNDFNAKIDPELPTRES